MVTLTTIAIVEQPPTGTLTQWTAVAYLGVVSMFLGFFAWYRGLAIGPMTRVSQVQLAQPVLSILWAAVILREQLTWPTVIGGVAVILCASIAVRTRLNRTRLPRPTQQHADASAAVEATPAPVTVRDVVGAPCGHGDEDTQRKAKIDPVQEDRFE